MKFALAATRFLIPAATIVVTAILLAGCSGSTEGLLGRELYNKSCEACHGEDGLRGTQIGAGSDAVELTDEQIRGAIEVGPGSMPGFPRLSPEQLDSLVVLVRELQAGGPDGG
jgi:mono/diheme cytochrome c family protein